MSKHEHEIWQLLDAIQMDIRAANAKLTELRSRVAALNLEEPDAAICETCGIKTRGPLTLAEHRYTSHDGPLPTHWQRAEQLAAEPEEAA